MTYGFQLYAMVFFSFTHISLFVDKRPSYPITRLHFLCNSCCHFKLGKVLFFKFSPLLDATKFMVGKYRDVHADILFNLPSFTQNSNEVFDKILDKNNK